MKKLILFIAGIAILFPVLAQAEQVPLVLSQGLEAAVRDAYDTPRAIKWAREGNIKALAQMSKDDIEIKDKHNNNLFHVAKDAKTVQAIAALIRRFYGAETSAQIQKMVNQPNLSGETPLLSQINAGHADTFRPLYAYSILKQKNDIARNQLARLRGSGEAIEGRNKAIYCKDIRQEASAGGRTLLEAAQGQVPYHPEMLPLSQLISHLIPCLAQN